MIIPVVLFFCFIITFFTSAIFSGAEIAIGSISRDSVEKLIENKVRGASLIYVIIKNRRRFHLLLLAGRIISIVGGAFFLFTTFLYYYGILGIADTFSWGAVFVLSVSAFIFAESVLAKVISMGEYEDTVSRFAYFLVIFHKMLFPLTFLLERILTIFIKKSKEMAAKEEALIELVKSESEDGVIEREEKDMIQSVLDFSDTTVREVMVPRIDIVAVEKGISVDELIALFEKEGHSRIPVYDKSIDNIMGVIYAKDILPIIAEKGKDNFLVTGTMRKAFYVHETKKISLLLKEFKKAKVHIAVVVDEYGGTAGIVALEDVLEEIVGEIQDEYDHDERDYLWINDRTVLMDAGLDVDDVNEIIHTNIPREDFDTLAGFVYHLLGVIPSGGEEFRWENISFTVRETNKNRISKVLVKLDEPLIKNMEEAEHQ
ncbi:MAG: HlyC/CorC family transporter [Candidatus Latescibacteria bacterium]|nr:HlyC/CorC family transporter [Candidatus Latescibacterota bacterium]